MQPSIPAASPSNQVKGVRPRCSPFKRQRIARRRRELALREHDADLSDRVRVRRESGRPGLDLPPPAELLPPAPRALSFRPGHAPARLCAMVHAAVLTPPPLTRPAANGWDRQSAPASTSLCSPVRPRALGACSPQSRPRARGRTMTGWWSVLPAPQAWSRHGSGSDQARTGDREAGCSPQVDGLLPR